MKIIAYIVIEGVNTPSEPLPDDAKKIVFNGTNYIVYEEGDELPADNFE